jgi:hypothetical protein
MRWNQGRSLSKVALFSQSESLVELYAAVREWRKAEPRGRCGTSWRSCSHRAKRLYSVAYYAAPITLEVSEYGKVPD